MPGGIVYVVMRYVRGSGAGRCSARSGRFLLPEPGRSSPRSHRRLDTAHAHGIIHLRNVKPANMLFDASSEVGEENALNWADGDARFDHVYI